MTVSGGKNVLILGAYGLIGYGITRHLLASGHHITGLGRCPETAHKVLPNITWHIADVASLTSPSDWDSLLSGQAVVVNCTGALQDGLGDSLEALHHHAVAALAQACAANDVQLIQISAAGATLDAPTRFLTSKARGDAAIKTSGAQFQIFRPGLVLAPHAFGGSAMLRMLAAVPRIQPMAMGDAPIQTTSLADIALAVDAAVNGKIPSGFIGDLVEPTAHPLRDVVSQTRNWLGFGTTYREVAIPNIITMLSGKIADGLSLLGWRSPLRSTSLVVLRNGVKGDPSAWNALGLHTISPLAETLAKMPATAEDRLFARMSLLMPLLVGTLFFFWLASGLVGLANIQTAALTLENVGWPHALAIASVAFWAVVDIAVACAIIVRKTAKSACWAMILVSLIYLVASTLFTPHLWADPLGPLIKIFPSIALALVTRIALEIR